jgi:hypothetical protein
MVCVQRVPLGRASKVGAQAAAFPAGVSAHSASLG